MSRETQGERVVQSGYGHRDTVSSQGGYPAQPYPQRSVQMNMNQSPQRFQTEQYGMNTQRSNQLGYSPSLGRDGRDTVGSQGGFQSRQDLSSAQRLTQSAALGRDTVNSQTSAGFGNVNMNARFTTNLDPEEGEPIRYI